MAIGTFPGMLQEGTHAARPAATAVGSGTLYACSDHALIYQSDGATWSTWATLGGGTPAAHAASHENGGSDEIDVTGLTGAGGAADDPIADVFGAPTTAFEFASSSLTGLTAMGTPDTVNAHTTIPDAYFIKDNATGTAWCGHYAAPPATPF